MRSPLAHPVLHFAFVMVSMARICNLAYAFTRMQPLGESAYNGSRSRDHSSEKGNNGRGNLLRAYSTTIRLLNALR
jgi:hypothetical protein